MGPVDAQRPTSNRIVIARLVERAIAADPGVSPTDDSGRWLTRDGDRTIPGVVVAAAAGGQLDVSVHLVAHLPPRPLEPEAETLRAEIVDLVRGAGLAERMGRIDVTIHDLRERSELVG